MSSAGHGPNIGHGYVKYVIIDKQGNELAPIVFPAMIGRAARSVAGAISRVESIDHCGSQWWTGEEALLAPSPITILARERLVDPVFLPVLARGALQRFGNGKDAACCVPAGGSCVTGLPATRAADTDKAKLLGEHLRTAHAGYGGIRVIPEPLGLVYAAALDNHGQVAGDPALLSGSVGVVDPGHHTVDVAVLRKLVPVPTSLDTYALGTARPLQQIRAQLSATFERESIRTLIRRIARADARQASAQHRRQKVLVVPWRAVHAPGSTSVGGWWVQDQRAPGSSARPGPERTADRRAIGARCAGSSHNQASGEYSSQPLFQMSHALPGIIAA